MTELFSPLTQFSFKTFQKEAFKHWNHKKNRYFTCAQQKFACVKSMYKT